MHGDVRPDAGRHQRVDERVVVGERLLVDHVALRLDARPLDAEAVRVQVQVAQQLDVVERPGVAAHGVADERAVAEPVGRRRRPQIPIGGHVLILDLRRGGRAPKRKLPRPDAAAIEPGVGNSSEPSVWVGVEDAVGVLVGSAVSVWVADAVGAGVPPL